jgi:tetratricopeptide (TPR) repeat protein
LFISITREYAAYKYLSDYKNSLKDKKRDIKFQDRLLKKSLSYSRSNAETFFKLGKLYAFASPIGKSREERIKSYAMSRAYFLEGINRKPTDGRNRAVYARYTGNKTDHAIEHFNMAINLNPTDAYIHRLYAMWCMNQVKKEINIKNTVQFVEKYRNGQDKDEPLKAYGDRYINGVSIATFLKTGQMEWDRALSLYTRRSQAAYNSLGDLYLLRYELDKAIANYKRANNKLMLARCYIIKDDPGKAVNILGSVIKGGGTLHRGNLTEIKNLLMVVIDNAPKNYQSFYCLGEIYTRLGKPEKAIENFKTTVHLNPGYLDAHLNLAELYNQTGKVDLAIEEYETILEQAPNHKEATHLLGEAIKLKYKR